MCKRVKCPHCGSENINMTAKERRLDGDTWYLCNSCSMSFVLKSEVTKVKTPLEKLNDRVDLLEDKFNELTDIKDSIKRLEEELKRRIL